MAKNTKQNGVDSLPSRQVILNKIEEKREHIRQLRALLRLVDRRSPQKGRGDQMDELYITISPEVMEALADLVAQRVIDHLDPRLSVSAV